MSLSPSLASHAPRVNKITANSVDENIFACDSILGFSSTKDNIIPSKHSSDMSKWESCIINAINENIKVI